MPSSPPAVVPHRDDYLRSRHTAHTFGVEGWCFFPDQHPHPQPAPEPSLPQLKLLSYIQLQARRLVGSGPSQPTRELQEAGATLPTSRARQASTRGPIVTLHNTPIFRPPLSSTFLPVGCRHSSSSSAFGSYTVALTQGLVHHILHILRRRGSTHIIIIPSSSADSQPLGSLTWSCATAVYFTIPHHT